MTDPIRGKVARILNSREIAINVGRDDGVYRGMYFDVISHGPPFKPGVGFVRPHQEP